MATELTMPRLSDSMEEGTITRWLVAVGEAVTAGQPLVEVETDKATVVHEAQDAGVILALTAPEGASVPVGAPIARLGTADEAAGGLAREPAPPPRGAGALPEPAPRAISSIAEPAVTPRSAAARAKASPLARRLAAQAGVALSGLTGSGPHGRVIRADVERAIANGHRETPAKGATTLEELTSVQRTIARRMAESRATVPDIELRCQVDMSDAVRLREQLRDVADPLPTYNDLVIKAAATALRAFPRVNGAYRDGRFETFSRINVGIAVAADDALLVPSVFDADRQTLVEIATITRRLAARAREGTLTPAELAGGTFTVSNLGMFGVDSFSAVINPPQAAILTVGSLEPRPLVDSSGAVVARPTVILSLACDHRIVYGAEAARFLGHVREALQNPARLLLAGGV